jgi:hypothetical protein
MECSACHGALVAWMDRLVRSCDVLSEIGRTGELKRMRETQTLLAEGRRYAQAFNEEYARLCQVLREHVSAVKARQAEAGPARVQRPG